MQDELTRVKQEAVLDLEQEPSERAVLDRKLQQPTPVYSKVFHTIPYNTPPALQWAVAIQVAPGQLT